MSPDQRESSPRNPRFRLFNKAEMVDDNGEIITRGAGWFSTGGVPIGDLGIAILTGERNVGETGPALFYENGALCNEDSAILDKRNYFLLYLSIRGSSPIAQVTSKIHLPNGQTLINYLEYDDDPNEDDFLLKHVSFGFEWHLYDDSDITEFRFFDKGDPDILSQLEFEFFTQGVNPTNSQSS